MKVNIIINKYYIQNMNNDINDFRDEEKKKNRNEISYKAIYDREKEKLEALDVREYQNTDEMIDGLIVSASLRKKIDDSNWIKNCKKYDTDDYFTLYTRSGLSKKIKLDYNLTL